MKNSKVFSSLITLIFLGGVAAFMCIPLKHGGISLTNAHLRSATYKNTSLATLYTASKVKKANLFQFLTKQYIIVSISNKDKIGLYGMEFVNDRWVCTYDTVNANIGRNSFAKEGKKLEGDLKTPTGVYFLGPAFGYSKDSITSEIDFVVLDSTHYWVTDSESSEYNKLVHKKPKSGDFEIMKRKDNLYKYGIIIKYNMDNPIPKKGSAIFIHVERGADKPTAGCVSINEDNLINLINWLKTDSKTKIILSDSLYTFDPKVISLN